MLASKKSCQLTTVEGRELGLMKLSQLRLKFSCRETVVSLQVKSPTAVEPSAASVEEATAATSSKALPAIDTSAAIALAHIVDEEQQASREEQWPARGRLFSRVRSARGARVKKGTLDESPASAVEGGVIGEVARIVLGVMALWGHGVCSAFFACVGHLLQCNH